MSATRVSNTNGATARSSASALAAVEDGRRARWFIQNAGTNVLNVIIGSTTINLQACTAQDDGKGGAYGEFGTDVWDGAVTVTGTSPRYHVYEYLR